MIDLYSVSDQARHHRRRLPAGVVSQPAQGRTGRDRPQPDGSNGPSKELAELRDKLRSPRTRYRQESKVAEAVAEILAVVRGRGMDRHRNRSRRIGRPFTRPTADDPARIPTM